MRRNKENFGSDGVTEFTNRILLTQPRIGKRLSCRSPRFDAVLQ
jgi:hypothetical protein